MRAADLWTRERTAVLEKLWAEGATARAIADRLGGVSRAAVLGKIFRLRLDAGASPPAPAMATPANQTSQQTDGRREDAKSANAKQVDAKHVDAAIPVRRRRGTKRDNSPPPSAPTRSRGKSLLELANNDCRSLSSPPLNIW
jgi:GcrA cell cycle regulator